MCRGHPYLHAIVNEKRTNPLPYPNKIRLGALQLLLHALILFNKLKIKTVTAVTDNNTGEKYFIINTN